MEFVWKDFSSEHSQTVESFFDDEAIKFTACDDGFTDFYEYWNENLGKKSFWAKVIFENNHLIAVMAVSKSPDNTFTIQEFVVAPDKRGQGYGSKILKELLSNSKTILGSDILTAVAVIFPENYASQKAFLNSKFEYSGEHPDGDTLYYKYRKKRGN